MRKHEPTIQQALAKAKWYEDLTEDLIRVLNYKHGDEFVIEYLLKLGYKKEEDIIDELGFDRDFVNGVIEDIMRNRG
jgi:hypothetical protein